MDLDQIPDGRVDILAVGAHPDDVEILMGGTVAKLSRSGKSVGIVDLTNAEPTPANEKYRSPDDFDPDYDTRRHEEARRAADTLGVELRATLDLPNRSLFDTFESRCALATVFRKWKPSVVIVMHGKTVMASPDHYQTQLITEAAIFYSRLTKWEKYFSGLPVHHVSNLLYVPTGNSGLHPEGEAGKLTSFLVDITSEIETKKEAILSYRSQFQDQGKEGFIDTILERNRMHGRLAGVEYAEHFASVKPLLMEDLSSFV